MKIAKSPLKIATIVPLLLLLYSCNPIENESKSSSLLIVENVTGTDLEGNEANFLQSDVEKVDSATGQRYVTADIAKAKLKAVLLSPVSVFGPSAYNDILVTRYVVSYTRTDGKNQPGVDVPYPFEGSLSALIKIDSTSEISFIIVREVSKLEPPLINLAQGRGEGVLTVTAKIDFYGQDMTKNKVKATGYLTIWFANYIEGQATSQTLSIKK